MNHQELLEKIETARRKFEEFDPLCRALRLGGPSVGRRIAVDVCEHYAEHQPMLEHWARRWQSQRRR